MKTFLFCAIVLLASCTKCATCTRTWTYSSYQTNQAGTTTSNPSTSSLTEQFEICGGEDIENAEEPIKTTTKNKLSTTVYIVTVGNATCRCTVK